MAATALMRLVVDASVLVADLLRAGGRERLADPRLELFVPEHTWSEFQHELPRRATALARRHGFAEADKERLIQLCLGVVEANATVIDGAVYAPLEDEARSRVVRDQDDWPLVACALVLDVGIWTADNDLLGTGVPTWTTQSLVGWLQRNPPS